MSNGCTPRVAIYRDPRLPFPLFVSDQGDVFRQDGKGGWREKKSHPNRGYRRIVFQRGPNSSRTLTRFRVHNIVWIAFNGPIPKGLEIDHENGNKSDNRLSNLRLATHSQNLMNRSGPTSKSKTRVLGVYFNRFHRKWHAQIEKDQKRNHLGYFANLEDAKRARIAAEQKYFGEFAPQRN